LSQVRQENPLQPLRYRFTDFGLASGLETYGGFDQQIIRYQVRLKRRSCQTVVSFERESQASHGEYGIGISRQVFNFDFMAFFGVRSIALDHALTDANPTLGGNR
jgi:hypothetical protein